MTPLNIEWNISLCRFLDAVMQTLKKAKARAVMKNMQHTISAEYTYKYCDVSRGPMYAWMSRSETIQDFIIIIKELLFSVVCYSIICFSFSNFTLSFNCCT